MAVSQRDVGGVVGGGALGVGGAEVTRQAVERDMIPPGVGWLIVGGGAGAKLGVIGADMAGIISLPDGTPALLAGIAAGSTGWYTARSIGLAPRLTVDIPEEINLASPLITAFTAGLVGLAATAAFQLAM